MADYRPLVLSGTAAASVITELPASSILITDGVRVGASSLSISGHLELLGGISGTPSISATTITADNFAGPAFNAAAASVSATAVSGVLFNGMPYPPPFAYAQTTSDGTAEDGEQTVGIGADITSLVSDSTDLSWDDTGKYFNVSAAGTYEFTLKLVTTVGGTTVITIKLKKNTSVMNTVDSRIHSSIDPTETTVTAIFTAVSTDTISATTTDDNTDNITVNSGTTMMLKRLK